MPAAKFAWPPKTPDRTATARERTSAAVPSQPAPANLRRPSVFRSIERTWLGLTTPPLTERIAAAGWVPSLPHEYCPRCGHNIGPHESDDTGCSRCRSRRFPWERLIRLGEFSGLLREVIHEVKFTRWRRLGHDLGLLLGAALNRAIDDAELPRDHCVLVPVPCSFRRRIARGIDHTLVLSRGVAAATGLPIVRALSRSHRPTQLSLPASQRAENIAGSMRPRRGVDLAGRFVIVLDDVTTTRATLLGACRTVEKGCKSAPEGRNRRPDGLWAAVAAVTPPPSR